MRETESLLIAAQNNAIRTNYVKAKIDKAQQISRCTLSGDRDETINCIVNYAHKTRRSWVGKVVPWELYKKFKFDHTNK